MLAFGNGDSPLANVKDQIGLGNLCESYNENAGADAIARVEETLDWVLNDKDRREDEYQDKIDDLKDIWARFHNKSCQCVFSTFRFYSATI